MNVGNISYRKLFLEYSVDKVIGLPNRLSISKVIEINITVFEERISFIELKKKQESRKLIQIPSILLPKETAADR